MRRAVIAVIVCGLCGALAATAGAAPAKGDKKTTSIDAKAVADKLEVWRDDLGQYYVAPRCNAFSFDDAGTWVFYGDGKHMYQQRIIGSSSSSATSCDWTVWAPRVTTIQWPTIELTDPKLTVECGLKDKRVLTQLKADEAKAFFAKAAFQPPLWQRQSRFLARDDDGVYYFVDMLREEYGGHGYRVFVGLKGAMKEQAMTNVVEDSGGEIYATKSGSLKIIANKKTNTALWIKGGKKVELTVLEPGDNRYLIYRTLGIYGTLGAVCDDL